MITAVLILVCVALYWLGGQKWAHTLFRDFGCTSCILTIAIINLGWHPPLLGLIPLCWMGLAIGDHEKWQWTPHAFVISLGMAPYAIENKLYLTLAVMSICVVAGTYLSSKFLSNKLGIDVYIRGLLYATIPLWFVLLK